MILHYLLVTATFVASIQGGRNCGPNPSLIYLKRGDKSSVEYWVPPPTVSIPSPSSVDEFSLQSRHGEEEEEEEHDPEAPSSSSPDVTTVGGLTTWRTSDEESADQTVALSSSTLLPPTMNDVDAVTWAQGSGESLVADTESPGTAVKVTDVASSTDDVTTLSPHAAGVNDHQQLTDTNDAESAAVTETDASHVASHSSDVTEQTLLLLETEPLRELTADVQFSGDGSGIRDVTSASGDGPETQQQILPEEINMVAPITGSEFQDDDLATNKAELIENIMMQEDLQPHQTRTQAPKTSSTFAESVTVENMELIHPTSQSPAAEMEPQQVSTEEPSSSTDSVQIEVAKNQVANESSTVATPLSVSSQLHDDVQDISHVLMEIPALPQSDNQVKEITDSRTEEPETTVTVLDFEGKLGFAVDTHSEEIESQTHSSPVINVELQTEEPKVLEHVSIRPDESIVSSDGVDLTVGSGAAEPQTEASGSSDPAGNQQEQGSTINEVELETKVEGSGSESGHDLLTKIAILDDVVEGSGFIHHTPMEDESEGSGTADQPIPAIEFSDPVDNAASQAEESGSGSSQDVPVLLADERNDEDPELRTDDVVMAIEEESPPEFRNDDILINRIRTIVNSLTNPRETSSFFLRRTSDYLQSVFKRTKRSEPTESSPEMADLIRSPAFLRFLRSQPLPMRRALSSNFVGRFSRQMWSDDDGDAQLSQEIGGDECDLHIKTDPGLHLLLTFHNLSAPYTVDCAGAYVEIEREGNGFEARWCGNPIGQQRGVRSHVIFARSEVRVSVYSNKNTLLQNQIYSGEGGNSLDPNSQPIKEESVPTGFSADIEVIDLHDAGQYTSFQRSEAYSNVHRRIG